MKNVLTTFCGWFLFLLGLVVFCWGAALAMLWAIRWVASNVHPDPGIMALILVLSGCAFMAACLTKEAL